jgi:arginase family enzyme
VSYTDHGATEVSENRSWVSIHSLLTAQTGRRIALVGAPLVRESITPGRYDVAPDAIRGALKRLSVYDLETRTDLSKCLVHDAGNVPIAESTPAEALAPLADAVGELARHAELTIILGGHNGATRPGVRGLGGLDSIGVLTLDAHFDLRDTDGGLNNGNPIQALLDDGLPGAHISQVGLAPFANTRRAHGKADRAGISVRTLGECFERGFVRIVADELDRLAHACDQIYVDFDIDVIDRSQMPSAPGARAGGISCRDFFAAARIAAAHPKVRCVDLVEFDPSIDVNAVGTLTAARWVAEILAGFFERKP